MSRSEADYQGWLQCWDHQGGWAETRRRLDARINLLPAQRQEAKPQFRVNRSEGPMAYLADVIVKKMEGAGWPSRIAELYRSPERQQTLNNKKPKVTNAGPFESPHQFYEAADIVHKTLYWKAPPEYWETLAAVVRIVSEEYRVDLTHGHHWRMVDSAHVELTSWRDVRNRQLEATGKNHPPTKDELTARFKEVLPAIAATPGAK